MAERRTREIWTEFCLRHLNAWITIEREDPGFLADLRVTRTIRDLQYATEGAVVRDLLPMHSVATQNEAARSRTTQVEPTRESRGTQTEEWAAPAVAQRGPEPPRGRPVPTPIRPGCWNCDGAHPYTRCPQPCRLFCYSYGKRGVTLRECNRCGSTVPKSLIGE